MARNEFSSREEEALYRLVVVLNGALRLVVMRLEEMTTMKILSPEYLHELKRLTDKIEKEIVDRT